MRQRTSITDRSYRILAALLALTCLPAFADPLQYDITGELYTATGAPVGTFTVLTIFDSSESLTLFGPSQLPFTIQQSDISSKLDNPVLTGCCGWPYMPNSAYGSWRDSLGGLVYYDISFCAGCADEATKLGEFLGFSEGPNPYPWDSMTLSASGVKENVRVPEPGTLGLLALGLAVGALWRHAQNRKPASGALA